MQVGDLVRYITPEGRYASRCALGIITGCANKRWGTDGVLIDHRASFTVLWGTGRTATYPSRLLEVIDV
jgi:hypothetical protein